jgi:hypothetical protein
LGGKEIFKESAVRRQKQEKGERGKGHRTKDREKGAEGERGRGGKREKGQRDRGVKAAGFILASAGKMWYALLIRKHKGTKAQRQKAQSGFRPSCSIWKQEIPLRRLALRCHSEPKAKNLIPAVFCCKHDHDG